MKRFAGWVLAVVMLLCMTACGGNTTKTQSMEESKQVIAMDTAILLTAYGENRTEAICEAEEEVYRLEDLLSKTDETSLISQLNMAGEAGVAVGEEICTLLAASEEYAEMTGGAFDITVAPVVEAWGFTTDSFQVPAQQELDRLLKYVGRDRLTMEGETAVLQKGSGVDLGGIAKGYASDRIAEVFQENDVPRGLALLGGNVLAWGEKEDGTGWKVGIQDPKKPNSDALVGIVELKNGYAVTSGGYQRFFEEEGKTYHHIIDPATGYPADNGLTSVTIVAGCEMESLGGKPGNGTMCDALSTALFVMGEEKALEFWQSGVCDFEAILVTADDRVIITDGLAEGFIGDEGTGYRYETAS